MNLADAIPETETLDAEWAQGLLRRQVEAVGRLAEVGLKMATLIEQRAEAMISGEHHANAGDPPATVEDLSLAYHRVSRAVRLSLMLQERLLREILEGPADGPDPSLERKDGIQRIVTRIAGRQHRDNDQTRRLVRERLDQDFCGDVIDRPISELIALICHDLNLDPDWPRLAREAWAQDEISADTFPLWKERHDAIACDVGDGEDPACFETSLRRSSA